MSKQNIDFEKKLILIVKLKDAYKQEKEIKRVMTKMNEKCI